LLSHSAQDEGEQNSTTGTFSAMNQKPRRISLSNLSCRFFKGRFVQVVVNQADAFVIKSIISPAVAPTKRNAQTDFSVSGVTFYGQQHPHVQP
jgi:hypothetical protein